jgi:hypothetical protein
MGGANHFPRSKQAPRSAEDQRSRLSATVTSGQIFFAPWPRPAVPGCQVGQHVPVLPWTEGKQSPLAGSITATGLLLESLLIPNNQAQIQARKIPWSLGKAHLWIQKFRSTEHLHTESQSVRLAEIQIH